MNIITPKISSGQRHYANGYILLISVIIVGAIATAIAVGLLYLGAGSSKNAISHQQSEKAKAAANACAEEALEQIRLNQNYSGSGNISINGGMCEYSVINTGGQNRAIDVSSTMDAVSRRVFITVTAIMPKIIATWQETP